MKKVTPRRGNITLHSKHKNARELLRRVGLVIFPRLLDKLGFKSKIFKPLINPCGDTSNTKCFRLVFSVKLSKEEKKKVAETFDFFDDLPNGEIRIYSIPVSLLLAGARDVMDLAKVFGYGINRRGDFCFKIAPKKSGEDEILKSLFRDQGFVIIPMKKGSRPGFLATISLDSLIWRDEKQKDDDSSPVKLEKAIIDDDTQLPKKLVGVVDSILDILSQKEKMSIILRCLPEGIGLYDTKEPFRMNGKGMVVNSVTLEEVS